MYQQAADNLTAHAAKVLRLFNRNLITGSEAMTSFSSYTQALADLKLLGAGYAAQRKEDFNRIITNGR